MTITSSRNEPALEIAITKGRENIVMLLIDHGSDINLLFSNKQPLLSHAVKQKLAKLIDYLLDQGVAVDVGVDGSTNPLAVALEAGNIELVKRLIQFGADPNYLFISDHNRTALYTAVQSKNIPIIKYLLEHEANPYIADAYSNTAFAYAEEENLTDIFNLFMKYSEPREKLGEWNIDKNQVFECVVFDFSKRVFFPEKHKYQNLSGASILELNKSGKYWCQPKSMIDSTFIGKKYIHNKLYEVIVMDTNGHSCSPFVSYDFLKCNRENTNIEVKEGDFVKVPGYFLNDWNNRISNETKNLRFWFQPTGILSHETRLEIIRYGDKRRFQ